MPTSHEPMNGTPTRHKQTGPRTPEGRRISSMNALKHGLTATKIEVLPTESSEEYREHIDGWVEDLALRNRVELGLAQVAVRNYWKLQRANRIQTAKLTEQIQSAQSRACDEVESLGARLFRDSLGSTELYGVEPYDFRGTRTSVVLGDDDEPGRLVRRLEATLGGVRWLIAEWTSLASLLEPGKVWQGHDKLKSARLLGCQPIAAASVRAIAEIFVASWVIHPERESPFAELRSELSDHELKVFIWRVHGRWTGLPKSGETEKARQVLIGIVGQAIDRLTRIAAELEDRAEEDAIRTADCLSFDESRGGELIRRYELAHHRALLRTIADLVKLKRATDDQGPCAPHHPAGALGPAAPVEPVQPIDPSLAIDRPGTIARVDTIASPGRKTDSCRDDNPEFEIIETKPPDLEAIIETKSPVLEPTVETEPHAAEATNETKPPDRDGIRETKSPGMEATLDTEPHAHAREATGETKPPDSEATGETKSGSCDESDQGANSGSLQAALDRAVTLNGVFATRISTAELQMSVLDKPRGQEIPRNNRARPPAGDRRRRRNRGHFREETNRDHVAVIRQLSPLLAALPPAEFSRLLRQTHDELQAEIESEG